MHIITQMTSVDQLKAYRDHVGRVLDRKCGSPKGRKLDELAAELAGAKDWNTAVGMIKRQADALLEPDSYKLPSEVPDMSWVNGCHAVLLGLVSNKLITEADLDLLMDEAVDQLVGTSQWISDNVNNQGYVEQLKAISQHDGVLEFVAHHLAAKTGIRVDTLFENTDQASHDIMLNPDRLGLPFDLFNASNH